MIVQTVAPWIADGLILLGSVVITIGVVGMFRMPDIYTKLHAASKAVFLGICSLLLAVMASGEGAIVARAALIAMLLVLTTPVAAHEIAQAARREQRGGEESRRRGVEKSSRESWVVGREGEPAR